MWGNEFYLYFHLLKIHINSGYMYQPILIQESRVSENIVHKVPKIPKFCGLITLDYLMIIIIDVVVIGMRLLRTYSKSCSQI